MKYCPECWKRYDGKTVCPDCSARLYDNDDLDSFTIECGLLTKCYGSKIPYGVTAIGRSCVGFGTKISEIIMPNTVKYIGDKAFYKWDEGKAVTIPSSVTHIGDEAFSYCQSLIDVKMPGIKRIGVGAFSWCTELKSATIGSGIVSICDGAFGTCRKLESVTIGKGLTSIGGSVFWDCNKLTSINYGGTTAQWRAVKKDAKWNERTAIQSVRCSDGTIKYGAK